MTGRAAHDFDAFGTEDLIKGGGELGVPIEQVLGAEDAGQELPAQVTGLLGYPFAGRVSGDGGKVDLAAGKLDEEEDGMLACDFFRTRIGLLRRLAQLGHQRL